MRTPRADTVCPDAGRRVIGALRTALGSMMTQVQANVNVPSSAGAPGAGERLADEGGIVINFHELGGDDSNVANDDLLVAGIEFAGDWDQLVVVGYAGFNVALGSAGEGSKGSGCDEFDGQDHA